MSAIDVEVPQTKWSMLEWHNPKKEKPKKDERVLMDCGSVVHSGRYVDARFICAIGEIAQKDIRLWSSWPTAPKW